MKLQAELRFYLKKHPEFKRNRWREKNHFNDDVKLDKGRTKTNVSDLKGEFVEHIKNMNEVDKYIKKYENKIQDESIEHAYVIHDNGKVMHYTGNKNGVLLPNENLKNVIITHNHPLIEGETSNSFEKDDFTFLQNYGLQLKKLRATYGNVRYEVQILKDISKISYDEMKMKVSKDIDLWVDFIDFGDLIFQLLNQEGYVIYAKAEVK